MILFGLFNLGGAIFLCLLIAHARKNKQLKITLITSGPMTKVEKVVLKGRGLTVAIVGWGSSAILFTFSGLSALFPYAGSGANLFITFIGCILATIIMPIANYFTIRAKD